MIPVYYNFAEFTKNYIIDFENWKLTYTDGSEMDYLNDVKSIYYQFIDDEDEDEDFKEFVTISYLDGKSGITKFDKFLFDEYVELMQNKIKEHLEIINENDFDDNFNPIKIIEYIDVANYTNSESSFLVVEREHNLFKYFISEDVPGVLYFDYTKYKNFGFFLRKVFIFIEEKQNIKPPLEEIVNKEFSINRKQSAPNIIAVLSDLGVFAQFYRKNYSRAEIIDVLHFIIGSDKTNIGKYYDSYKSNDLILFNSKHIDNSKEFLSSKGV